MKVRASGGMSKRVDDVDPGGLFACRVRFNFIYTFEV